MTTLNESRGFEAVLGNCGASQKGAKWLKMAVDPFHDIDLDLVGFPDQTPGRSYVTNVTKNLTVATNSAGNAYDAHIAFIPLESTDTPTNCTATLSTGNTAFITETANTHPLGIIKVNTNTVGAETFRTAGAFSAISIGDQVSRNSQMWRVIGCAFEVHNTTPSIYKSGAVTVYRHALHKDTEGVELRTTIATTSGVKDMDVISGPPSSAASAKLLNGITWDAADGCLVPCLLDSPTNPPQAHIPRSQAYKIEHTDDSIDYFTTKTITDDIALAIADGAYTAKSTNLKPSTIFPYMISGAYFTGLSAETTLTVTLRCFVEVFPMPGDPNVSIAHPSTPSDIRALQCYSEIVSMILAGYPVTDNASGDYFRKLYNAAKVGLKIAKHIPVLAPAANAASAGFKEAEMLYKLVKPNKKKSKNQQNVKKTM